MRRPTDKVEDMVRVLEALVRLYDEADEKEGGSGDIDWSDLDEIVARASLALDRP